eukprot:scaffold84646_cov48-Prasinocladus_malaysianus.AAC.2
MLNSTDHIVEQQQGLQRRRGATKKSTAQLKRRHSEANALEQKAKNLRANAQRTSEKALIVYRCTTVYLDCSSAIP